MTLFLFPHYISKYLIVYFSTCIRNSDLVMQDANSSTIFWIWPISIIFFKKYFANVDLWFGDFKHKLYHTWHDFVVDRITCEWWRFGWTENTVSTSTPGSPAWGGTLWGTSVNKYSSKRSTSVKTSSGSWRMLPMRCMKGFPNCHPIKHGGR